VRIDFGFTTALAVVVAIGAGLLLVAFVGAASRPLGWAIACGVAAALLIPIVGVLDKRMPRPLAVIFVLLGVAAVLGGFYAGVAGTIADNVDTLKEGAPAAAAQLEQESEIARDFNLEERVTTFVDDLDERLGAKAQLQRSTSTLSAYVVTGVLTVFLIGYGNKLAAGALSQIRDVDRRERIGRISHRALKSWRMYSLVALGQVVVVTIISWVVLYAIDLPAPFILGLLMGGFSIIPLAGVVIGGLPALLFAAGTLDLWRVGVVIALVIGLQLFEALVVRRRVDRRTLYVGPALPLIVALIGWDIYGLGGAIYGVLLLILALAFADAINIESSEADPTTGDTNTPLGEIV
jgi:predicted PurR-regulated permease PerM